MNWKLSVALILLLTAGIVPAHARAAGQEGAGAALCRIGSKVDAAREHRRWPGEVRGNDGKACQVYLPAYYGVLDIPYADLLPAGTTPADGGPDTRTSRGGTVSTTPGEIVDAFRRDPEGAKARFTDVRVRVTGTADSIDEKSIWLKKNLYETGAVCMVEPEDRAALRQVREGAQVTVEGVGKSRVTSIALEQCRVVGQGPAPVVEAGPARPPLGRYFCMNAGQGLGYVTLAASTYTVDGVTGSYRFDSGTQRFTFTGGSYPKWGWTGEWRTDPAGRGGPPEPRIVLTGPERVRVSCFPRQG